MTNTQVAQATAKPVRSVLIDLSTKYGMEPAAFEATLRGTVVPANTTREEFAAFLLVAKEYDLNPVLKEIFAFPKKGGGIQPIVSIDGWLNIINSHPDFDGMEFADHFGPDGKLSSITCKMYRKDRGRPVEVTEYMTECVRATDVWRQWPARMLRHKATIQAARYAFGFSGIMEPDEADRMVDMGKADVVHSTPAQRPEPTDARGSRMASIIQQHQPAVAEPDFALEAETVDVEQGDQESSSD